MFTKYLLLCPTEESQTGLKQHKEESIMTKRGLLSELSLYSYQPQNISLT